MDLTVVLDNQFFDKYKDEFFSIYHEAFPENERQPDEIICSRFKSNYYHFVCCFSEESELLGFALLVDLEFKNFSFVEYFAVKEFFRQQGVGSQIIQKILTICTLKKSDVILEVENPIYGGENETKEKRIQFYSKNKFSIIKGFEYILPALNGKQSTEMLFMCSETKRKRWLFDELMLLTKDIYFKVYSRGEKDFDYQEIIKRNKNRRYYEILSLLTD